MASSRVELSVCFKDSVLRFALTLVEFGLWFWFDGREIETDLTFVWLRLTIEADLVRCRLFLDVDDLVRCRLFVEVRLL